MPTPEELAALDDLVIGRGVRRGRHDVPEALTGDFRERLVARGFVPTTVGATQVPIGVRAPAWLYRVPVADFGWVFWELFTETKKRKLFGSTVRNAKGDWAIQIPPGSTETVWVNEREAQAIDASRPQGIW